MSVRSDIMQRIQNSRYDSALEDLLYVIVTVLPISLVVGIPLIYFIWGSFWSESPGLGGHFTLKGYQLVFTHPAVYETIGNTLIIAVGGTVLSISLGVLFMVYSMKTNGIGRRFVPAILISQYLLPSYIAAISWEYYAGPRHGALNQLFMLLPFIDSPLLNVFSLWGIIIVGSTHYAGLVYLLTSGGIKAIPASLEEIGWVSGASLSGVVRRVTIPLVLPGLAISAVLIFTRFMQSFGLPLILGFPSDIFVISTLMYNAISGVDPNFTFASALGIVLLTVTLTGLYFQRRLTGAREQYETLTGKGGVESMRFDLGRYRYPVSGVVLGLLVLLYIVPYLILFMSSFQQIFLGFQFDKVNWTLANYEALFVGSWSSTFYNSVKNTIIVAVVAGFIGMIISTLSSYIIVKSDSRIGGLLDYLTFSPSAIPGIIFGTALLWLFLSVNPFGLYGTIWVLVIAFSGKFLMYGTRAVNSSFRSIGQELEDAARVSGAGMFGIFRRIFAPLIKPGFTSGFIIYVIDTSKVLTIPVLLSASGNEMIQVFLFRAIEIAESGIVAATAVIMMVIIFSLYGIVHVFTDIDISSL